jgi:hypothetical protein
VRLTQPLRAGICLTRVGRGERVQDAAMRVLGEQGAELHGEEHLLLYAALTDEGSAGVYLVFRTREPVVVTQLAGHAEPWVAPLLELYDTELRRGLFAVHTGGFDGTALRLRPVDDDREPLR